MINFDIQVNEEQLNDIEKKLGNLKSKAPIVLVRAINRAAAKARTETKREVANKYYISQENVLKTIRLTKASTANLSAQLTSKGGPIALSKFKVSPDRGVKWTGKKGKKKISPSVYKAGVEKSGGMKPLSGSPKAFIAGFSSGHSGVMTRISARRLPLKQLYGPAVPSMIKNDEVIERIQKEATETLEKRIDAEINNILQRG